MKFVENMTYKQRKDSAQSAVVIESAVTIVQVAVAMATGNASNWFAAMFCVVLGTVSWVVLTPNE